MEDQLEHDLDKDQAKKVLEKAIEKYKEKFAKYNPEVKWADDYTADVSFSAKGFSLDGQITVKDNTMDVELDVPFVFRVFKGKAMDIIRDEIDKWTEKAKKGDI